MRRLLIASILVGTLIAPSRAAEPEGVLICTPKGGFDCAQGKCNTSRVTSGDITVDFGAKTICAMRAGACQQPQKISHAMIEEPGKTTVVAVTADNATMLFRIGANMKLAMVFVVGTSRVLTFEGECRKPSEQRALAIRQSSDGHYYVTARVNGSEVRMVIDTGATNTVLNKRTAERAGLFPAPSEYTVIVRTASGIVKAAPVRLRALEIGEARFEDVPALVMDTAPDTALLGIGTLQRFKSYEVRNGVLTLRW